VRVIMPTIRPAIEPTANAWNAALTVTMFMADSPSNTSPIGIQAYERCRIQSSGWRHT
jgi:hypothetical protein